MPREKPFDLYIFVSNLVAAAPWIEEILIFGSRKYLSNASYGSDIDLLVIPNREVSIPDLLNAVNEPYVDAFLVAGSLAISVENQTHIPFGSIAEKERLDPTTIWKRTGGWQTNENYRTLYIFPDRAPTKTYVGAKPILILCALASEFNAVVERLPTGNMKTHPYMPPYYKSYVRTNSGRDRLVAVVQTGVASVNAAISSTRILGYYEGPELAILVGITAGIRKQPTMFGEVLARGIRLIGWGRGVKKGGASLGDVLVPTATVDVESGKVTPKGKEPAGLTLPMSPDHQKAIASWGGVNDWQARWETSLSGKKTKPTINADCTLACTSSVIGYGKLARSFLKAESQDSRHRNGSRRSCGGLS